MQWASSVRPSQLRSCECKSEAVEQRPDGIVRLYRCAECHTILGDIAMGHEP